jgi:hypothetical protein
VIGGMEVRQDELMVFIEKKGMVAGDKIALDDDIGILLFPNGNLFL